MNVPLDDQYLEWLYSQVESVDAVAPERTYWSLLRQLYSTEFVWFVPNDDNRIEDGKDLRYEFFDISEAQDVDPSWPELGCSVLEMMIGLSRRLTFEVDGQVDRWFWTLIDNLGLGGCTDEPDRLSLKSRQVEETLDRLIFRTYDRDGSGGGLFPLRHATRDQRKVEIWYQLSAYLLERS